MNYKNLNLADSSFLALCTSNEHSTNVLDSKLTGHLIIPESGSEHHF